MDQVRAKLLSFIPMANYIASMNGERAEALIHDISNYERSIIYITPQNITGRSAGGPLTDYAIRLIREKVYEQRDYVVNYLGRSSRDDLFLRSSTYFIKDEGRLIGLLCVNIDITEQVLASRAFEKSLMVNLEDPDKNQPFETFSLSTDEMIHESVKKKTEGGRKLRIADKRDIVAELYNFDVFLVKGTVPAVAAQLDVSEKTVYRYINEIKKERENKQ